MIVYGDATEALRRLAAGDAVVLVQPPGADPLGPLEQAPGRLAVMCGSPDDPAVAEAAQAMEAELFGRRTIRP